MSVPPRALGGMVESDQIAWIGTLIGAAISLPLGVLLSGADGNRATALGRPPGAQRAPSFPELILAIIFVSMVGLGPQAGAIAIGIGSGGTFGKLTAEEIESMD